jgi:hypothetical protein
MAPKAASAKSLARVAPAVARQWHPTKNGAATPRDVSAGSHEKAWWKCPRGVDHVWRATVGNRARSGNGCPFCSGRRATSKHNLALASPRLAAQWHPRKNGTLRPRDVTPLSSRKVFWRCAKGHAWETVVRNRMKGARCPFCSGRRATRETSLASLRPAIARQWHKTRNGDLSPRDVTIMSGRTAWWKCTNGPDHEWRAAVDQRTRGRGCPFCAGKRVSVTNSLAARRPDLARTWHPSRNGKLTTREVTAGTSRRVWWKCSKGPDHEWLGSVANRNTGFGCPYCGGRRVSVTNSLAAREPKVARQWHPTRNGRLTPHDVTRGAGRRVWWRCHVGHEWQQTINGRTSKQGGCPLCRRRTPTVATRARRRTPVRLPKYDGVRRGLVRMRAAPR